MTQTSGMTAIFCKLICGLARGKHHRLQMLKSFQVQRRGKANPEPGTVATERPDADSVCRGAETTGGDDGRVPPQQGFWDPPALGKSQWRMTLSIRREFYPTVDLVRPSVSAWVCVCDTRDRNEQTSGGKHLLAWGGQHTGQARLFTTVLSVHWPRRE